MMKSSPRAVGVMGYRRPNAAIEQYRRTGQSMMAFAGRFFAFWADFLIGDDWAIAVGVVVALTLAHAANLSDGLLHDQAWMIAPIGVILALAVSLRRAVRSSDRSA